MPRTRDGRASRRKPRRRPDPPITVALREPLFPKGISVVFTVPRSRVVDVTVVVLQTAKLLKGRHREKVDLTPLRNTNPKIDLRLTKPACPGSCVVEMTVTVRRLEDALLDLMRVGSLMFGEHPPYPWSDQIPNRAFRAERTNSPADAETDDEKEDDPDPGSSIH